MADTFDINDRHTWTWVYEDANEFPAELGECRLNPRDRDSFYQVASNGVFHYMPCPAGLVFNPMLSVCDYPDKCPETAIYDWAVSKGLVNDQR